MYSEIDVRQVFNFLNSNDIKYTLLLNNADELPCRLQKGKDIDILIHESDHKRFIKLAQKNRWSKIVHPFSICGGGYRTLYGMPEPIKFVTCSGIMIDINSVLACQSFFTKAWIPLDNEINESIWNNRVWNEKKEWWQMDEYNTVVYLIVRSIFDKKYFSDIYCDEIHKYIKLIDDPVTRRKLQLIFYKFTDKLIELVKEERFRQIIDEYIAFADY